MQASQAIPKYRLIYEYYAGRIQSGELADGQQLPTEEELCGLFGVSRVTVRRALSDLMYQGFIVKKHSKGSFVQAGMASMCLDSLQGFTEEMARRGLLVSSKLQRVSLENAGALVAEKLGIDERSKVYIIERLRLVEEEPMAVERVILPYFCCPELTRFDLTGSLYAQLEKQYGLRPQFANQILEAGLAPRHEAELLGIRLRSPVLKIERTSYLSDHTPMEYALSVYRGDKYKFYVTMRK